MKIVNIANNQFELYTDEGVYFQSYDSVVAFKPNSSEEKIRVGVDWDYSRTTMKYVSQFLGQNTSKTRKDIKDGIILVDYDLHIGNIYENPELLEKGNEL